MSIFDSFTRFLLLSCVVAACTAELESKEHELVKKVENNVEPVPGDVELADPIKSAEIEESIESALTGYDIVIGDPVNVINSGTVRDRGVKKQIFEYDPNDPKKMLQPSVLTGCSSVKDATVINTVGKFRSQIDSEAEVSGSVSGGGFGVSASFAFSASRSSSAVEDHIAEKKGSLTIFTMTCSLRHLDVGNMDVGFPPFNWKFANFIVNTLGTVDPAPSNARMQKIKFKSLLVNYGTHYISQANIGARVTTTTFISRTMTSTMSQSTIKACASASAKVDYMATVSAEVSAKGCSASDRSKFNSNDKGVEKTVKNSYGTTKVPADGTTFNMGQIKEPRPIWFKLAPIIDLLTPTALMYGIPNQYGRTADPDGAKRNALSSKILSWLEPMFKKDDFQKNYCEAFKHELPNCGKLVSAQTKKGCGYTGACGVNEECVNTATAPYYQCKKTGGDKFLGKTVQMGFNLHNKDCYLFWRGDEGNTKNMEFRCGSSSGDKFWIKKSGANLYKIGFENCPLYWSGDEGNTKNGEFRCGQSGDEFWIREQANGMWAIGFYSGSGDDCPLYWRGDEGNTKNGEFRCHSPISDTFWIRPVSSGDQIEEAKAVEDEAKSVKETKVSQDEKFLDQLIDSFVRSFA